MFKIKLLKDSKKIMINNLIKIIAWLILLKQIKFYVHKKKKLKHILVKMIRNKKLKQKISV